MQIYKRLTPRECVHIQIERNFIATLGKYEHEIIARQLLIEMSILNDWNYCFNIEHFNSDLIKDMKSWIKFVNSTDNRFMVNEDFINRMHYISDNEPSLFQSILRFFNVEAV